MIFEEEEAIGELFSCHHIFGGRKLLIKRVRRGLLEEFGRTQVPHIFQIFIEDIHPAISQKELLEHFRAFGPVVDFFSNLDKNDLQLTNSSFTPLQSQNPLKIQTNSSTPKRFAYLVFSDAETLKRVISRKNYIFGHSVASTASYFLTLSRSPINSVPRLIL